MIHISQSRPSSPMIPLSMNDDDQQQQPLPSLASVVPPTLRPHLDSQRWTKQWLAQQNYNVSQPPQFQQLQTQLSPHSLQPLIRSPYESSSSGTVDLRRANRFTVALVFYMVPLRPVEVENLVSHLPIEAVHQLDMAISNWGKLVTFTKCLHLSTCEQLIKPHAAKVQKHNPSLVKASLNLGSARPMYYGVLGQHRTTNISNLHNILINGRARFPWNRTEMRPPTSIEFLVVEGIIEEPIPPPKEETLEPKAKTNPPPSKVKQEIDSDSSAIKVEGSGSEKKRTASATTMENDDDVQIIGVIQKRTKRSNSVIDLTGDD
ncbi:hypothetical protein BDR26DRAFT_1004325 [Obelidium mucronatum]|nr:hypothetical protein BDR26DRAFT_1004325 [Obelidium mucronatum]